MEWNRRNILIILLTMITTVGILYGGQALWQNRTLDKPLDAALKNIAGVTEVRWEDGKKRDGKVTIYATLANVENFPKTYTEIYNKSKNIVGTRPLTIEIKDSRTPDLEEFYYIVQPGIQEGIATGNFTAMVDRVQALAEKEGIKAAINVDSKYVYVHMTKDGSAMYATVPRLAGMGGGANGTR